MRVACIQLSSSENYKKNCLDIIKLIFKAIKEKADLALPIIRELRNILIN